MRVLAVGALMVGFAFCGAAQETNHRFDPKVSYSAFAEYSNDSSHILIGQAENRKMIAAGGSYNRRLKTNRVASWRYQVEVTPLLLLRDPKLDVAITSAPIGSSIIVAGTSHYSGLQLKQCASLSGSGFYYETEPNGAVIPIGSFTYNSVCTEPWTYGGGVSPLGQRVNFLPRRSVQPFVAVNAGFVTFAGNVPATDATRFNFSFEFGGGVEWYAQPGRAWALDFRYHHISNAGRGNENPGVDNGTFKLAYSFGH